MDKDIQLLEEWLTLRGIPREDREVPWEASKALPLSQRVLRLYASATNKAYERAQVIRHQDLGRARELTILECAAFVHRADPRQAERLVIHMGLTVDALDDFVWKREYAHAT